MMRLFLGLSVACLLSLSSVAAVHADTTNENTNISVSGSANLVGISNSNEQSQLQIGSISDSFKAYDIDITSSFRIEGNDTDFFLGTPLTA
jgi:hypothetical protein